MSDAARHGTALGALFVLLNVCMMIMNTYQEL